MNSCTSFVLFKLPHPSYLDERTLTHEPIVEYIDCLLLLYVNQQIVSCAGDGMIQFTDLDRESTYGQFQFDCHAGTTYEVH